MMQGGGDTFEVFEVFLYYFIIPFLFDHSTSGHNNNIFDFDCPTLTYELFSFFLFFFFSFFFFFFFFSMCAKNKNKKSGKPKRGLDLNRDYNTKNEPVRRSAPSLNRDAAFGGRRQSSGGGGRIQSARVQHLERPLTAGANQRGASSSSSSSSSSSTTTTSSSSTTTTTTTVRSSTPSTTSTPTTSSGAHSSGGNRNTTSNERNQRLNSRQQERIQHRQQREQRERATPPQRASVPTSSSTTTNPPAPSMTTPQLIPPQLTTKQHHPESTPSPDVVPVPAAQRRSAAEKERERKFQQIQEQQKKRNKVQATKIPKLRPNVQRVAAASAATSAAAAAGKKKKRLFMSPDGSAVQLDISSSSPSNALTPPYILPTVEVDAGPLGIDSLRGHGPAADGGDDNEDEEIVIQGMEEEHADLVTEIFTDEETLVSAHREQIHEMMNLVKEEMTALDDVEAPGSIIDVRGFCFCSFFFFLFFLSNIVSPHFHSLDPTFFSFSFSFFVSKKTQDYVEKLEKILLKKTNIVKHLKLQLEAFKKKLEEEEELSASIGSSRNNSPASKMSPPSSNMLR